MFRFDVLLTTRALLIERSFFKIVSNLSFCLLCKTSHADWNSYPLQFVKSLMMWQLLISLFVFFFLSYFYLHCEFFYFNDNSTLTQKSKHVIWPSSWPPETSFCLQKWSAIFRRWPEQTLEKPNLAKRQIVTLLSVSASITVSDANLAWCNLSIYALLVMNIRPSIFSQRSAASFLI